MEYALDKASPRPWKLRIHGEVQPGVTMCWLNEDNEDHAVSVETKRLANAAHILRCVNEHEKLEATITAYETFRQAYLAWATNDDNGGRFTDMVMAHQTLEEFLERSM